MLLALHGGVSLAQDATSAGNQAATLSGNDGILSVTVGKSCVAVTGDDGTMTCDSGEATTMQMILTPGRTFSLDLVTLYPSGAIQFPADDEPVGGGEGPGSRTPTTRPFRLDATMSRVVAGYDITPLNIDVPSAYSCLYTATYAITDELNGGVLRPGEPDLFLSNSDNYKNFYRTARLTNIHANTRAPALGEGAVVDEIPRSAARAVATWGGATNINYQDLLDVTSFTDTCTKMSTVVDIFESRNQGFPDILTSDDRGQIIFDGNFVTSTAREGPGSAGSYSCQNDLCCGQFGLDQELGHCDDDTVCTERAMQCSANTPYLGSYVDRGLFYLVNVLTTSDDDDNDHLVDKYDDDDDNDGCSYADDDESNTGADDLDSGGICYGVRSTGCTQEELNPASRRQLAEANCDCSFTSSGDIDYDTCEPRCTVGLGLRSTQEGGSMNDINLIDSATGDPLRGGTSRRFNDITDEKDIDDDNDDETGSDSGSAGMQCYNTCNSASRTYCPEHCRDVFAQDLRGTAYNTGETGKTNPACRQLNGQLPVQVPVSIYIDDGGDTDDDDNTGMLSVECVQNCQMTPGCDPVRDCSNPFALPNEDDGDDDDGRKRLSNGPSMVNNENMVLPGASYQFGNHLTRGGSWFSDSNGGTRGVAPEDDAYGSIDDDYYCSVDGIGDQPTASGINDGTWVARCPVAFCIAPIQYQPDDNYYFQDLELLPDNYFCPLGMFPPNANSYDIRRICNEPLPQRVLDSDDPDAPYAYDQLPFTVCPTGHRDRMGLITVDQLTYTTDDDPRIPNRVMGHDTAEAIGALGAYCMPNKVAKTPRYYYNVTVTITDLSPNADPDTQVETLVMTPQTDTSSDGTTTTFYALSSDNTIYAKLLGLKSADNVIAPDLDATIMLCNATADGGPGTPDIPYRMAGDLTVSEAAQSSPWLIAAAGRSYFWDSTVLVRDGTSGGGPVIIDNNDFLGLLPLPEVLYSMPGAYDQRDVDDSTDVTTLGIKKGSWWYMLTGGQQAWLGEGLGQLGMRPDIFSNSAAAEQACLGAFCSGVPGIEGNRWTLQMRNRDSGFVSMTDPRLNTMRIAKESLTGGARERYVRDYVIEVNTPAMVNGRLHDFLYLDDPESLKNELVKFKHLPASYFSDVASTTTTSDGRPQASLPTMFIQGNVLLSQDPAFSTDSVFERFELSFENTVLLDADSDLQDGQFVDNPVPICAVGSFSSSGQLTLSAENLGDQPASFTVSAECDGSVSAGASQTRTLDPGQTSQFTIVLAHTGPNLPATPYFNADDPSNTTESAIPADAYDFTCTAYLGTPVFPNPQLYNYDTAVIDNCKLAAGGDTDTTASVPTGTNTCTSFGVGCPAVGEGDAGPTDQKTVRTYYALLVGVLVALIFMAAIIACIMGACSSSGYQSRKEAELNLLATQ